MRALLAPALLLAVAPAQEPQAQQLVRDPNTPQAQPATGLTSVAPELPAFREAAAVPAVTVPPVAQNPRRSARRPDATIEARLPDHVIFDQPVANGGVWALGESWKAEFSRDGMLFIPYFGSNAPHNFPLRVSLASATVGGEPLALTAGEPIVAGTVVRTPRGTLTEVVHTAVRDLEQSFEFATLPNRGAVAVDLAIDTELACTTTADGLQFGNAIGSVYYRQAIARDAAGRSLPLTIDWDGDSAHIEIPASFVATATLPLVLDPVLGAVYNLGTGAPTGQLQRLPDVATLKVSGNDVTCVTWRREWSASDHDVWAQLLDANLNPIGGLLNLDFSYLDWRKVAIASNNYASNYLVVSEIGDFTVSYIGGRLIGSAGTVGTLITIERDGVFGLPGQNFRPDVGGDVWFGSAGYYTVVFEKQNAGASDIYMKQVDQTGTPLTTNPIALDTATTWESNPSISKCNGDYVTSGQSYWLVTWQRTWPSAPNDEEVLGTYVNWSGSVPLASPIYIAGSVDNETQPAACSPIQGADGLRYWAVAFERGAVGGGQRDIWVRVFNDTGAYVNGLDLSTTENATSATYDQSTPDMDSDGIRFAITYAEPWAGVADLETKVTTLSLLTATNTFQIDDNRASMGLSVANEATPRICASHSGSGQLSNRFVIANSNDGNNQLEAYLYGGYQSGSQFSVYSSQCGTLAITPSGETAVGHTVQIDVANGPLSGTIFGYPGYIPLNPLGCNCVLGVQNGLFMGNPLVFQIPADPVYVGLTLSVQGFTVLGSQCLTYFDLSDTIDFTIR